MQPDTDPGQACTILAGHHLPSWQSPRCGLPTIAHSMDTLVDQLTAWLSTPNRFLYIDSGEPVSREEGLLHILFVCFLWRDLESISTETWDSMGELEASTLRSHEHDLRSQVVQWAAQNTIELEAVLGPEPSSDNEGELDGLFLSAEPSAVSAEATCLRESAEISQPADLTASRQHSRDARGPTSTPTPTPRSRSPAGMSAKAKGKRPQRPPAEPEARYLAAARAVERDESELRALLQQASAAPSGPADERTKVAIELYNRQEEGLKKNAELREASRKRNLELYGSKVAPPKPKPARMPVLPSLPPDVDLPLPTTDPAEPQAASKRVRKKHKKPEEVQDMARVPTKRQTMRTAAARTRNEGKKARARVPPAKKAKVVRKAASGKRVRPSQRKAAEEPDSDTTSSSSEDEAEVPVTQGRQLRKRPRVPTPPQASSPPSSPPQRPVSKRQRVEVLLDHRPPPSLPPRPKPRPRMVRKLNTGPVAASPPSQDPTRAGPSSANPRRSTRLAEHTD